ncbi:MAG: hypothetical protein CSB06_00315 [Bacteroidia bacterium]|nr:MAG: hypothetical protein CSB06_00315 [Bacteroidia bacterium]
MGKIFKWIILSLLFVFLFFVFKTYNPQESAYFLQCPFRQLTAWKCPGCGAQSGIHYLLNLQFLEAWRANALLIVAIPCLLFILVFKFLNNYRQRYSKQEMARFRRIFIFIFTVLTICFWIFRNTSCGQHL